jgi:hypothetical protein
MPKTQYLHLSSWFFEAIENQIRGEHDHADAGATFSPVARAPAVTAATEPGQPTGSRILLQLQRYLWR